MKDHDNEGKVPDARTMATKLFLYTLAGVIAYVVAAIVITEVFAP